MKTTLLITFTVLLFKTGDAQETNYSLPETGFYSDKIPFIIGKISGNIFIWENYRKGRKNILNIYDSSMSLVNSISEHVLPWDGELYQLNCINQSDSFLIILQYYRNRTFYCMMATYNEKGNLLREPVILDKIKNIDPFSMRAYLYQFIKVPDKPQYALARALTFTGNEELACDCILFDKGKVEKKLSFSIPFSNNGAAYTPFVIDNNQNIVFATCLNDFTKETATEIIVQKVNTASENISSVTQIVHGKILYGMSVAINRETNDYNLIGLYSDSSGMDADNTINAKGIFITKLNDSLNTANNEYFSFAEIAALKGNSKYKTSFSEPQIGYANNNSFTIVSSLYVTKPDSLVAKQYWQFSHIPLYKFHSQSEYPRVNPSRQVFPRDAKDFTVINEGLIIFYYDTNNGLQWTRTLYNQSNYQQSPLVGRSIIARSQKGLRIIYPNTDYMTNHQNKLLSYLEISSKGKILRNTDIFNNSPYEIETSEGIPVDENEIVFPCIARHGRLAFMKVRFE